MVEQTSAQYDVDIWVADLLGRGVTMVGELKSTASSKFLDSPASGVLWSTACAATAISTARLCRILLRWL